MNDEILITKEELERGLIPESWIPEIGEPWPDDGYEYTGCIDVFTITDDGRKLAEVDVETAMELAKYYGVI